MSPDGYARRINACQKPATRFGASLAAPCRDDADFDHRRRRHVVGGGGAAAGAGRIAVPRAQASLPFTLAMVGFALGGVLMGRLFDRTGILGPLALGAVALSVGYLGAAVAGQPRGVRYCARLDRIRQLGDAWAADRGHLELVRPPPWRRGDALLGRKLCRRHDLAAGRAACHRTLWLAGDPCRIALTCGAAMFLIGVRCSAPARRRAALLDSLPATRKGSPAVFGLSARALQTLLALARFAAVSRCRCAGPHRRYCGDLGYGVARGADMLALMMAFGIVGRIGSGFIADRIGGLPTLMLGSALQA